MNRSPEVSVIIPVYNAEPYLRECLDSVINQTLKDIEIICVNDGSTDHSLLILEEYAALDSRITVLSQDNSGLSMTRNAGLKVAHGEYIYFLDSDDYIKLECLEELTQRADRENLDMIFFEAKSVFDSEELENSKKELKSYYQRKFRYPGVHNGVDILQRWMQNNEYYPSSVLFITRRSRLCQWDISFLPGILHEDNLFTFLCLLEASRVGCVPEQYYYRRVREDSIVAKPISAKNLHGYFLCCVHMLRAISQKTFSDKQEKAIKQNILNLWGAICRLHDQLPKQEIQKLLNTSSIEERILFDIYLKACPPLDQVAEIVEVEEVARRIKVSVIIPVYNVERYLYECLDSVINQTLEEIEIICVDDGSSDGSIKILLEYARQDSRVQIIRQENQYAGAARNRGMDIATGEYLYFMDSDDFVDLDLLQDAYQSAIQADADIVLFPLDRYDHVTHLFLPCPWTFNDYLMPSKRPFSSSDIPEHIFSITSPGATNKLYKRQYIADHQFYFSVNPHTEDVAFVLSTLAFAKRITTTASTKARYHYRINIPNSLETCKTTTGFYFWQAYREVKELLEQAGCYDDFRKSYINCALSSCLYELNRQNNYEAYEETYLKLKNEIFMSLDIVGQPEDWYGVAEHYDQYFEIMNEDPTEQKFVPAMVPLTKRLFKKSDSPKISVIMPVKNAERYIWECLDSLLGQTLEDFEVICVDDGSEDRSREILSLYAQEDPRITVLHQENRNAGTARSNGIKAAKGEYLIFLNAADFFEKNMLECAYNKAKKANADICVFKAREYNQESKEFRWMPWTCRTELCPQFTLTFSRKTNPKNIFKFTTTAPWNKLFRREFINNIVLRFTAISTTNDVYFIILTLTMAERITTLNNYLLSYRRGVPTTLQSTKYREPLQFVQVLRQLQDFLLDQECYEELKISFANLALDFFWYNVNDMTDVKSCRSVYDYFQAEGFKLFGIDLLTNDNVFEKNIFRQYQMMLGLSYEEYIKVKKSLEAKLQQSSPAVRATVSANNFYREELQLVYASYSYRIGRFITFIPRGIRGGIRCCQEHGIIYTLRLLRNKIIAVFRR